MRQPNSNSISKKSSLIIFIARTHWPIKNPCFLTHPSGLDVYLLYNVDRLSEMCHQTNMKFHQRAEAACKRSIVAEKPNRFDGFLNWKGKLNGSLTRLGSPAIWQIGEKINSFSYKFPICLRRAFTWGFFASASPKCNENALFVSRRDEKSGWWN